MLIFIVILITFILLTILYLIFYFLGKKENNNFIQKRIFECGFSPYFYSHISVSIHYYIVGLIFLLLDLELCLIIPFIIEGGSQNLKKFSLLLIFITTLLLRLIYEWLKDNLN